MKKRMDNLNLTVNLNFYTEKNTFSQKLIWVAILIAAVAVAILVIFCIDPKLCAKFVHAIISASLE